MRAVNSTRAPVAMPCSKSETLQTLHEIHQSNFLFTHICRQQAAFHEFNFYNQLFLPPATERSRVSHALSGLRRHAHVSSRPLMSSTPTTRSRTLLFLSYRDSRASSSTSSHRYALDNDGDENERLIDPTKDHIAIGVGLPPKWSGHLQS